MKKTRQHSTRPRKNGSYQLRKQEPEEREFVVDSGASAHMVNKKDLETMRTSRSPTTVMTANGEVLTNQRRSDGICQRIGLIRQSDAS